MRGSSHRGSLPWKPLHRTRPVCQRRLPLRYGLATPILPKSSTTPPTPTRLASVIRNRQSDQLGLDARCQQDFQIPYDPNPNDFECASGYYCSTGLRDAQTERDAFAIANWVHTFSPRASPLSFAPFTRWANYDSPPTTFPPLPAGISPPTTSAAVRRPHRRCSAQRLLDGVYTFYQHENDLYGVIVNDASAP